MKIFTILFLPFLIHSIAVVNGQKFSLGTCPNPIQSVTTLMFTAMVQTYREYGRSPSFHSHGWTCITYTITQLIANTQYRVTINAKDKITGKTISTAGIFTVGGQTIAATSAAGGYLTLTINLKGVTKTTNYYILAGPATGNFVVLYSCTDIGFGRLESVIVLAGTAATVANLEAALATLSAIGYPTSALKFGYNANCVYP